MWGLAASACRISVADLGSLNTSEAVLLVPRILASVFMSCTRNCLKR